MIIRLSSAGGAGFAVWGVCWALLCCSGRALSEEPTLPQEVREALELNAERLSPITVSYDRRFETTLSPKQAVTRLKVVPSAEQFFAPESNRVSWQEGTFYAWSERMLPTPDGGMDADRQEVSFDGEILYGGSPDQRFGKVAFSPALIKDLVSRRIEEDQDAFFCRLDYFEVVGFRMPTRLTDIGKQRPRPEILQLLDEGARLRSMEEVELDGRRLTRIALLRENPAWRKADAQERRDFLLPQEQVYVFFLDPTLHFGMRRREEWYQPETLLMRSDCTDFEELPGRDVWLPRLCVIDYYTFHSLPFEVFETSFLRQVYAASTFDPGPVPAERFVLDYTVPGTLVTDHTLPEARETGEPVTYTVPPRPEDLEAVIERARKRVTAPETWLVQRSTWLRRSSILLNVLLALAIGAVVLWRWKKRTTGAAK